MQRALLQYFDPKKRPLVIEALRAAGRQDLIGFGPECLVPPLPGSRPPSAQNRGQGQGRSSRRPGSKLGGRWDKDAEKAAKSARGKRKK